MLGNIATVVEVLNAFAATWWIIKDDHQRATTYLAIAIYLRLGRMM